MVFGVVGKLGGGKSFSCVYLMLQALRRGWFVTSNILLKEDYLRDHSINATRYTYIDDFSKVNPWELRHGDLRGSGGKTRNMIVVDEAGEWLDSYSDARHGGQLTDICSWLRQSDKLGQDVYFIVQFENLLHTRLRSIVHKWLVCCDMSKMRLPYLGLRLPYPWSHFICVTEYDGRSKERSGRLWLPKTSEIFGAYNTAEFFGLSWASSSDAKTMETTGADFSSFRRTVKPSLIFALLGIMWSFALCLFALCFFFYFPTL